MSQAQVVLFLFTLIPVFLAGPVDIENVLTKFGYMLPVRAGVNRDPAEIRAAVREYQRRFNLRINGKLNRETRGHMNQPRCGLPDFSTTPTDFRLSSKKWKQTTLKYKFLNGTKDLSMSSVKSAIAAGFRYWTEVTQLRVSPTEGSDADITVTFDSLQHGDGETNAFDGTGGVLAHAFFPRNGRIHFDDDEHWTEHTYKGINLQIVAAHEIGHSLGLGHTFRHGALMYPTYQGYSPSFKLHEDDIMGITSLYGRPGLPIPEADPASELPDAVCELPAFQAIAQSPTKTLIFFESYVYIMDQEGSVEKRKTRDIFNKGPKAVIAASFSEKLNRFILIKGRTAYHYYTNFTLHRITLLPKKLPYNPDSFVSWEGTKRSFFIAFRGSDMYTYDVLTGRVSGPHAASRFFPKSPASMHSATMWSDGFLYFFKGRQFWKVHPGSRRLVSGYPKNIKDHFMLCGGQLMATPKPRVFKVRPFPTPRRRTRERTRGRGASRH